MILLTCLAKTRHPTFCSWLRDFPTRQAQWLYDVIVGNRAGQLNEGDVVCISAVLRMLDNLFKYNVVRSRLHCYCMMSHFCNCSFDSSRVIDVGYMHSSNVAEIDAHLCDGFAVEKDHD